MRKLSLVAIVMTICVIAMALFTPTTEATSPGLITSISGTGITNIVNDVLPAAINKIKEMALDDVSSGHITVSSIRIPTIALQNFAIGTKDNNQIFLNLSHLDVTVKAHARYKHIISVSADFTASASGSGTISCSLVPSGDRFVIQLTQADIDISDFTIHISGGIVAKVMNAIKGLFKSVIRRTVQSKMSSAIREAIVDIVNRFANSIPNQFAYGTSGHIISLAPAAFGTRYDNNSVSVAFNGSIDGAEPERHGIDTTFAPSGALFDIFVDVFVFNSGFASNPFKTMTYDRDHPGEVPVPGWQGKDWALVIPIMAEQYADQPVRLEVSMLDAPLITSQGGQLSLKATGGIRVFAGATQIALIAADIGGAVTVALIKDPATNVQYIIPQFQQVGFKFTVRESIAGDIVIVGILESLLNFVATIATGIINTVMLDGLIVPSVAGLEFINPRIDFPTGAIRLSTDIHYTPQW